LLMGALASLRKRRRLTPESFPVRSYSQTPARLRGFFMRIVLASSVDMNDAALRGDRDGMRTIGRP
jgi:hypothetical protein